MQQHTLPEDVPAEPVPVHGHVSVLAAEAVAALVPRRAGIYIDGTFGAGGHTGMLAERIAPDGRIVCVDRDPAVIVHFQPLAARFPGILTLVTGSYADMR